MNTPSLSAQLESAYDQRDMLTNAASPSTPSYGQYSDFEWQEAYDYVSAKIYALEAALSALSPN